MIARFTLACPVLGALALASCSDREHETSRSRATPVTIADPSRYWTDSEFVEMTPPLRLPSRDGRERIRVWLRIPPGEHFGLEQGPRGVALTYPPGTIADRTDQGDEGDASSVGDVRGTRFEDAGREVFHVLRRLDGAGSSQLSGLEWRRDDREAEAEATRSMSAWILRAEGPGTDVDAFRMQNDCGSCHVHDKPERTSRRAGDGPAPNRGTDAGGLYVVQTVLADSAPLETHRAREMNERDPFVTVECGEGWPPPRIESRSRSRHYACDGGRVPYGRYDVAGALAAGDEHALAVCRSRAYLRDHLDAEGRAAFGPVLDECGL
ncbi:MAG TPA: hypothetical protein VIF09_13490 [Polyangiaceae bacterium]